MSSITVLKKSERLPHQFLMHPKGRRVSFRFGSAVLLSPPARGIAVVASKKVFGGAVSRNRVRRRVYAALRKVPIDISERGVIVYPSAIALTASFADLAEALGRVFS